MSRILEKCNWTTDSFAPILSDIVRKALKHSNALDVVEANYNAHHEREFLNAPNGSMLAIDWLDHPEDIAKKFHGLVVLVNHGCTQIMARSLFEYLMENAHQQDMGCCVVNLQGVNGVQATNASVGTGLSMIVELKAVTERIHQHLGSFFPKCLVGVSIGAIPVIEYLSQDRLNYSSACLISPPLQLQKWCDDGTRETASCIASAKHLIKENAEVLSTWNIHAVSKASMATSLSEIFAAIHSSSSSSVASLFNSLEPYSRLDQISKPLLMFYALDDESMSFYDDVDLLRLCRNPNIAVSVTEHGGHYGFRSLNKPTWLGQSVLEYLSISLRPEF
jgi:predicted alpha/beta-fold hydrolase